MIVAKLPLKTTVPVPSLKVPPEIVSEPTKVSVLDPRENVPDVRVMVDSLPPTPMIGAVHEKSSVPEGLLIVRLGARPPLVHDIVSSPVSSKSKVAEPPSAAAPIVTVAPEAGLIVPVLRNPSVMVNAPVTTIVSDERLTP